MPDYRKSSRALFVAIATSALVGCSTGGQKLTSTGFLGQHKALERDRKHKNVAFWIAPNYDATRYTTAIVEPVEWYAPHREAEVEDKLKRQFREALVAELQQRYRIVEASDAVSTTLRVRAAITNVRKTRWYINAPAQVASTLTFGGISLFAPLQGGASEEVQVEDAKTGATLVQVAAFRNGKPWNVKGSYVAYDHARMAFNDAAKRVHGVLGGKAPVDGGKTAEMGDR